MSAHWGSKAGWGDMQNGSKTASTLLEFGRVTGMAVGVNIGQWVGENPEMRLSLIQSGRVASVTIDTSIFPGMQSMPIAIA